MQWSSSRRQGGALEDTDPALEDPRSRRMRRVAAVGGGVVLVALAAAAIAAIPRGLLGTFFSKAEPQGPALERTIEPDELPPVDSARAVLADTEAVWDHLLGSYSAPRLAVVEAGGVESACGSSSDPGGPFYCPTDRKLYVDVSFLGELGERFAAQAELAEAYVLAHSIGHHIQALSGLTERIEGQRVVSDDVARTQLDLRQELQADCYAGVWAHHSRMRDRIAGEDIEAALKAAATVGDERAQRGGLVMPESFAHGTAVQRSQWFRRGWGSGQVDDCNAFEVMRL
jgi:predicted metalloprotease